MSLTHHAHSGCRSPQCVHKQVHEVRRMEDVASQAKGGPSAVPCPSSVAKSSSIVIAMTCPITQDLMEDPVCTCDGHSYERDAIEQWFARGNVTSPRTGLRLESPCLLPNQELRQVIEAFLAENEEYRMDRRSAAAALDERMRALEKEVNEGTGQPKSSGEGGVQGRGGEDGGGDVQQQQQLSPSTSVCQWLSRTTELPVEAVEAYAEALSREGATTMGFLSDADYTPQDLMALGVKRPHAASLTRAVESFRAALSGVGAGAPQQPSQQPSPAAPPSAVLPSAPTLHPEAEAEQDLIRWLALVRANTRLEPNHPVQLAAGLSANGTNDACLALVALLAQDQRPAVIQAVLEALVRMTSAEGGCGGGAAAVAEEAEDLKRPLATAACLSRLGAVGACEVVTEALSRHKFHLPLLVLAVTLLWQLAGGSDDNSRRLREAGACDQVVGLMGAFAGEKRLMLVACHAVDALARDRENQRKLDEFGGCERVVAAMRAFAYDRDVQYAGCCAVMSLCGSFTRERLRGAGARELLTRAMEVWPDDQPLKQRCTGALERLGASGSSRYG